MGHRVERRPSLRRPAATVAGRLLVLLGSLRVLLVGLALAAAWTTLQGSLQAPELWLAVALAVAIVVLGALQFVGGRVVLRGGGNSLAAVSTTVTAAIQATAVLGTALYQPRDPAAAVAGVLVLAGDVAVLALLWRLGPRPARS
jgi:hypothetical protein